MKVLLKLAIVALLANMTWHVLGVYSAHFKFKDAVQSASQYNAEKSADGLRLRILELAAQYDVPVTDANFTLSRVGDHTIADGSYTRPVELAPGFSYPWTFTWHVDTFTVDGASSNRLAVPK
jgi:hypothetical protein